MMIEWAQMTPLKCWLYLIGPILEGLGILVILFPDALPGVTWAGRWLLRLANTLANAVDRFARIVHDIRIAGGTASAVAVTARGRIVIAPGQNATLEEKVKFLFDKHLEIDGALDALRERFEKFEKETARRFEQTGRDVEAWTKEAIRGELERYRGGRISGSVLLFVGLVCSGFANFIK